MTLNQQLQQLVEEAPKYGVPAIIMQNGVIPVINAFAQQLDYSQYYVRQTLDDNLLLTILGSQENPEDAKEFPSNQIDDTNVVAEELPVSQILFQMFTMKGVDSVIFLEQPDDYHKSKEIYCHKLQSAIKQNLSNLVNANSPNQIA